MWSQTDPNNRAKKHLCHRCHHTVAAIAVTTWAKWKCTSDFPSLFIFPSGYLISVRDPELALPIEICLKGQLQAFTCDNHDDEKVLQGLMARAIKNGRRPTIITSKFLPSVHDTRERWGRVHSHYNICGRTVMRLLYGEQIHRSLVIGGLCCVVSFCQGCESPAVPLSPSSSWNWGPSCCQLSNWSKEYREHFTH